MTTAASSASRLVATRASRSLAIHGAVRTVTPPRCRPPGCGRCAPAPARWITDPRAALAADFRLPARRGDAPRLGPLGRDDPAARGGGPHPDRSLGSRPRPAGQRRPAAGRLVPRLPQPPRLRDRPAPPAREPHRGGRGPRRRVVRHPSGRVLPRADAGVGRAARRHRGPDRGQVEPGPARADRPRHRRLLRPRLEGHADARAQQPDPRPDQALPRACRSPSCRS